MSDESLSEHVAANRVYWDGQADAFAVHGERLWAAPEPEWGQWGVPDHEAPLLPDDCTGLDVVELGCGTAYVSGWAARRGARSLVGIDNSARQLDTARRLAAEHGVDMTFHHGNAEDVPWPDDAFDLAVSEYGAILWAQPDALLAETRRLLRSGGRFNALTTHPMAVVTAPLDGSLPSTREIVRPWFGDHRHDWRDAVDDPGGIEFVPTVGEWFRLAERHGFVIEDYRELRAPADTQGTPFAVTAEWARDLPSEHAFWFRAV